MNKKKKCIGFLYKVEYPANKVDGNGNYFSEDALKNSSFVGKKVTFNGKDCGRIIDSIYNPKKHCLECVIEANKVSDSDIIKKIENATITEVSILPGKRGSKNE